MYLSNIKKWKVKSPYFTSVVRNSHQYQANKLDADSAFIFPTLKMLASNALLNTDMFTDDRKRYMSVWIYIPLILSFRPEYSYWDQNLPFSSLSNETKRHPLLSHTACVPFPRIVICLWGLNLYQVTFYQRVFLWNLIEFSPHGDIPIYLFVLSLNTRNNLLYSTKFNVNQWL